MQITPRYVIPAIAQAMGNKVEDWQAASWSVTSGTSVVENFDTRREWYNWCFANARAEKKSCQKAMEDSYYINYYINRGGRLP